MKNLLLKLCPFVLFPVVFLCASGTEQEQQHVVQPQFIIYTYGGDPSTSLTVNWQTKQALVSKPAVFVSSGKLIEGARLVEGNTRQIEGLEGRFLHRVQLTNLMPDTTYYLTVADSIGKPLAGAPNHKIRTIPDDDSPLRFVTGGDMGTSKEVRALLKHAAAFDPAFAVVGGDVAYANGRLSSADKWDIWMTFYTEEMVTSDGFQIPLVLAIGNHEVNGGYGQDLVKAPFFRNYFGQDPERNYFSRRFGENLILLALDSGHTASHAEQAPFIREELARHADATHSAAVYHVPLYPSHRNFMGTYSDLGREHWAPVFDEMGLTVGFENHDHTYKRSHLLKGGRISTDGSGTLYLGDGCWGRSPRQVEYEERWYLKHSESALHFWVVDVSSEAMVYKAVDIENRIFDVYPETNPDFAAASAVRESMDSTYLFPEAGVALTPYSVKDDEWEGGQTTIKITNPFASPIVYTLEPRSSDQLITEGFSEKPSSLAPGASKVHTVSFLPALGTSIPPQRARTQFDVVATLTTAEGDTAEFNTRFSIPKVTQP